jgi:hypothetical protein
MLLQVGKNYRSNTAQGIIVLSLLAAVGTIFPGAILPASPETYAGCPEHRQPAPAPSQNSSHHECCQTGHQFAISSERVNIRLSALFLDVTPPSARSLIPERLSDVRARGVAFPDKPPSAAPIRI